ncbi:MAG: hypothetical protein CMF69_00510 [Magnetovibrio sp.]|nr:hypothetical protein [Magnetovibrio sp.]
MNNLNDYTSKQRNASSNEVMTVACPVTNIPIYDMDKEGNTFYLDSHGTCNNTGLDYHLSALEIPDEEIKCDPWPVRYYGYYSKVSLQAN